MDFRYLDKLTSCAGKEQNKAQSQSNGYKDATLDDGKSPMPIVSPKSSGKTKRRKIGLREQVVIAAKMTAGSKERVSNKRKSEMVQ